ncbi:hypothetical protein A2875_03030 [Candidatus Gottesmanbacteria bacterium RIFCSPHIGHO2_01_FULL_46_14]|uniref:DUF1648 domain-containing protein n=1 Tax=Candidatus Gottesmanbacteria bacterium RIFCSPHIGHO2_01_FULL_46_14 TaxID=1798380 RepID=A0A1F5ZR16_9BACT|nr:MAG: hypothetical protein A2875_03030 [Candidatus Gottesmanbacteria bacterium RIFCSPHIGHO2_01_FULL_46_14]
MNLAPIERIRAQWSQLLVLPLIRWLSIASISFTLLSIAIIAWWWRMLPPFIPLWYSRAWGQDQLANPLWLFLLPGASLFWQGLSLTLASNIGGQTVFSKLVIIASFFVSILSFVSIVQILSLVT